MYDPIKELEGSLDRLKKFKNAILDFQQFMSLLFFYLFLFIGVINVVQKDYTHALIYIIGSFVFLQAKRVSLLMKQIKEMEGEQ